MSTRVHGHHHVWYSPAVGRHMHVRWFGHGGARILAFPTTMGDHNEWPNRYMPDVMYEAIRRELLPFTQHVNHHGFVVATGASFGAFLAMSFGLRHPTRVHRILGMSGMYDIRGMTRDYSDGNVYACNPFEFIPGEWEHWRLEAMRRQDIIMAIGRTDPHYQQNQAFSSLLVGKGIGNAFREWDGFAHDWPVWEQMIQRYVGGHD